MKTIASRSSGLLLHALIAAVIFVALDRPSLFAQQSLVERSFEPATNLYAQALSASLNRNFASQNTEYLVLDLNKRTILAWQWKHREIAIPPGSLLKPFVALAYSDMFMAQPSKSSAQNQFPVFDCTGKSLGCWNSKGHGPMTLEQAIAESCNAYFLMLAEAVADTGLPSLRQVSAMYHLPAPPEFASQKDGAAKVMQIALPLGSQRGIPSLATAYDQRASQVLARSFIGLTSDWRIPPLTLASAYADLVSQTSSPVSQRILRGMRLAAERDGTAVRVGDHPGGVLAKTGTAPCVSETAIKREFQEPCIASGDGLVIVAAPAVHPRILLLVRQRGTTGAMAAGTAGRILNIVQSLYEPHL